jgi:hypothetical protein
MASSTQYTDERLDRLAGDIRDEVTSRREETSELRTELMDEIRALRKEHRKDSTILWAGALLFSMFTLVLSLSADDADASARPKTQPPLSRSESAFPPTRKIARVRVISPLEVRNARRLDDLDSKIETDSVGVSEDVRHLRKQVNSGLDEVKEEISDKADGLFAMILVLLVFGFIVIPLAGP